jgi:hypothetical protein
MTRCSRTIVYETAALVAAVAALSASFNSTAGVDLTPWNRIVTGNDGRVVAAAGAVSPGVPIVLTVSTSRDEYRTTSTTTYVRGNETLRMERSYDIDGGLDVSYSAKSESVRLLVRREPDTGETTAVVVLPDGEVRSLTADSGGHIVAGDPHGWHQAILAKSHVVPLLREFDKHAASLGGPVPESGNKLMYRIPDSGCLDACASGCKYQCAFECLSPVPGPCEICNSACALGCFIGCAS